jgi:hypothetical protein
MCRRRDVHTYTRSEGVAGLLALVHTAEVDQRRNPPGPPHWARQLCELGGPEFALRPSAFSQSDSNGRGCWPHGQSKRALCPIHTTACVKLGSVAPRRLTGIAEMQTGRAPMEGTRPVR